MRFSHSFRALAVVSLLLPAVTSQAAELVRGVRLKISAGDLATGAAYAEDYRLEKGVDEEYLSAIGWLARGAEMMSRPELAQEYVAELRRAIPSEDEKLLTPYGAAIEVEGRLIAAREGRGAGVRYFEEALARAKAPSLRSRIRKNINMLSMEGHPAPALDLSTTLGPKPSSLESLRGRPVLLFLWAQWCGDCKAQAPSLARVWQKYRGRGLALIAPTRLYGTVADKPASPDEEKAEIAKVWKETYAGLEDVPVVVSTETMVQYGASATPSFALIDRRGVVRLYTATRLSEVELSRRIERVLAEEP